MINKYMNKKSTAMMAVVLSIAMAFAGVVVIASDVDASNAEAAIGDTTYDTMGEAVKDSKDGDIIKLLTDVTYKGVLDVASGFTVFDDNNVTIDANGFEFKIESNGFIGIVYDLTIKNVTNFTTDAGILIAPYKAPNGTVTLEFIDVEWKSGSVYSEDDSKIIVQNSTMGGVEFTVCAYNDGYPEIEINNSTIGTINVGAVSAENSEFIVGTNPKIDSLSYIDEIKVAGNANLNVNGAEITVGAVTIEDGSDATVEGDEKIIVVDKDNSEKTGIGKSVVALEGDVIISGDAFLLEELVIPADKTMIIRSTGSLDLNTYNLTLNGKLIIENGGYISGTSGSEGIVLMKGASIENEGVLGQAIGIKVLAGGLDEKYNGVGEVSLKNASGIEFGLANITTEEDKIAQYQLTVTGEMYSENSSIIVLKDVKIIGTFIVGENVDVSTKGDVELSSKAVLTVDGIMDATNVIMKNNSTVIVNGLMEGTISAETGDFVTKDGYNSLTKDNKTTFGTSGSENITSYILEVKSTGYTTSNKVAKTLQTLFINGTLDFYIDKEEGASIGSIEVTGNNITIAEGNALIFAEGMTFTGKMVVDGQVVLNEKKSINFAYVGTSYLISTPAPNASDTMYIEPFDVALTKIDSADKKTLTVVQEVEIDSALTLTEGQKIDISADSTVFEITKDGVVTVEAKAVVTGTIDSVEGVLKVMKGATCKAPAVYATLVKGVDYTQYSGLQVALDSAVEGDTITIANETTVSKGDLVIPAGVTVIATEDITIANGDVDVQGKLVLEDGATLAVNKDKKADSQVTVSGVLDATEGTLTIATGMLTSTGVTTVLNDSVVPAITNGVKVINDDTNTVITSAQNAIEIDAAKDVPSGVTILGKVSADSLNVDADITVAADAVFKVGNAFISEGKIVDLRNGKTTGSFSASTGVEETTTGALTTSTVSFTDAYGIVIGEGDVVDSMNVKTHVLYVYGELKGKMTVDVGTATIGYDTGTSLTVDSTYSPDYISASLSVKTGATLEVGSGMTLVTGNTGKTTKTAAVTVDGTLSVTGTITNTKLTINGSMSVLESMTVAGNITVAGDVTVADKKTLVMSGTPVVKSGGSVIGSVEISDYLKAYAGADLSGILMNINAEGESDAFATGVFINSDIYMTIYTEKTDLLFKTIIEAETFKVDGLVTDKNETKVTSNWFKKADFTSALDDTTVLSKDMAAAYFKADVKEVMGVISVGSGLTMYIDGISIDNYKKTVGSQTGYYLTVGTHSVTYDVLSGYDGSKAVVTLDGVAVSNGSITIDADAESFVLSINGAVPMASQPVVIEPSDSEKDGMELTDILLIVLVVLIVIMAIIVALRMMRS